jgi:hypothetical protein
MTVQLEVIKFKDLVPILGIPRFVDVFGPNIPTIEIVGSDFSSVEKVIINELPAPEFIIVSKTKIYAQLPRETRKISSISVLSSKFTRSTRASKILFEIGDKTKEASGIQKLLQLFIKWMLQSPGSDMFNPERGGGLQDLVGNVATGRQMGPVLATVTRAVQNTVSQMRNSQLQFPQLPLSERLLSAEVISLDVFEAQMQARLKVELRSVAGKKAVAEVGL